MGYLPTLADMAKRTDPDGKVTSKIVEMLTETNEILDDMGWMEGNLATGHKTTIRTGLPSVAWRILNYGVQPSKSHTAQVTDNTGMLEAYAEIDKELAILNGNSAEWRVGEDRAFLEAMNQEMATTLFYGNEASTPAKFTGLSPRFSEISDDKHKSGYNVIDGGGTGSTNTSIWMVTWGQTIAHGIFPKGSKAGFAQEDLGEDTLIDANGGRFQGYRTHYQWKCGLTVRDWRGIVRIANIDTAKLGQNEGANLIDLLVKAYNRLGSRRKLGRVALYCNEDVATALDLQASKRENVWLSMKEWAGQDVLSFRNIPIRRVDALVSTEDPVEPAAA